MCVLFLFFFFYNHSFETKQLDLTILKKLAVKYAFPLYQELLDTFGFN